MLRAYRNGVTNAPPPAIIHRAEMQCANDLGRLSSDEQQAGAWTNSAVGPWNIIAHCYVRNGQMYTEVEQHEIPDPHYETLQRSCSGHVLLFDASC